MKKKKIDTKTVLKHEPINPFTDSLEFHLPENLDLVQMLFNHAIRVKYFKNNAQAILNNAVYLLGQIYNAMKTQKCNEVTLYSVFLQKMVRNYKEYLNYFEFHGIITINNSYSADKGWSKTYSFTSEYLAVGWKMCYILDSKFIKRFFSSRRGKAPGQYPYLFKWIEHLRFDADVAKSVLETVYPQEDEKIRIQLRLLARLKNKSTWTFQTCSSNRLFTPITGLKRELRSILKYKGEKLWEADIKNSIPYFALTLLDNELLMCNEQIQTNLFKSNRLYESFECMVIGYNERREKGKENIDSIEEDSGIIYPPFLMLGKNWVLDGYGEVPKLDEKYQDIKEFKAKVLNATVYEGIAEHWNKHLGKDKYVRKSAKLKLLEILNSPSYFESEERKALHSIYPNVMKIFERLNKGYWKTKNGQGKAKWKPGDLKCPFAMFTQRLEAWFLLDLVCGKISEQYPKCPLYTIHDSILTTEKYIDKVCEIVKSESMRIFGNEIQLHAQDK